MTLVGAFARVDSGRVELVRNRLAALQGVATFDLDHPGKIGLLIEGDSEDQAHEILTRVIRGIEGVWGVWPVYVHNDPESMETQPAVFETSGHR